MVDIVQVLKARLLETGMAKPEEIGGLNDDQIAQLERKLLPAGYVFPEYYKAFLRFFGRGAGWFYRGTDMFYPEILNNGLVEQEIALEALSEQRGGNAKFYVFSVHQGYQFWLFEVGRIGESVPSIIYFASDEQDPVAVYRSFDEFLEASFGDQYGQLKDILDVEYKPEGANLNVRDDTAFDVGEN